LKTNVLKKTGIILKLLLRKEMISNQLKESLENNMKLSETPISF